MLALSRQTWLVALLVSPISRLCTVGRDFAGKKRHRVPRGVVTTPRGARAFKKRENEIRKPFGFPTYWLRYVRGTNGMFALSRQTRLVALLVSPKSVPHLKMHGW